MKSESDRLESRPEYILQQVRYFLTCFVKWVTNDLKLKLDRMAWRILGNAADADDVLQKTLAKCWEEGPRIKTSPEGWVTMVHANHCRDRCRERKRQPVPFDEHVPAGLEPSQEPSNRVDGKDILAFATNAELLTGAERDVIALHYGKGISRAAIATMLAVSVARVNQIHGSAIAKLRRVVNEKGQSN